MTLPDLLTYATVAVLVGGALAALYVSGRVVDHTMEFIFGRKGLAHREA
jgi:hypothetical protein